ncbi:3-hydroxyacyl-[acyl-carrier-protein] dehydratase [Desulfitobacterium sp. LBE]|uniref:3-hydroxyacyl-[acyl-carrier-protein] dehydratase FabZ n=3 Tax=root TaxID=1 RepID=G9XTG4_DESHA|nr:MULTISPECIES: 3-hydroxyacyl-ACP dehydratase FabZ [Desulfitobacterium]ACL22753.1 beta-hydroxyacyl-(acyl-carrier-protein) dehydratase FabZ [Desulfitobacterium hafniense DCB-2]EHL05130.1 beta-hydroxyacyl-(acyl-carrier-protein) dehydratase FabZ [Desulfitobacterium hafniense DP7]MEA5022012.1 3-hydroxyacyl-ACP dehydratase FabZ [Desulfitobacterium hafniense]TWH59222.1 3-hydroxyacyl-[acyl-carrier-protein] dehydratase [Desulfitobacterium sp. LBE]
MLESQEIQKIIPHRYPFLLVDRILELEDGKRGVGLKNVSGNEPFFQGHFPGYPVMPGVLIMEALAQVGAVILLKMPEYAGHIALFAGLEDVRFRRQVIPGDQLRLEVELLKLKRGLGVAQGKAYVGENLAAEGTLKFAVGPKLED